MEADESRALRGWYEVVGRAVAALTVAAIVGTVAVYFTMLLLLRD